MKSSTSSTVAHNPVRTFFAGLTGTLAVSLVLITILIVWANRTLTDTKTFSQTVTPLVTQTEVQHLIASKLSDQLFQSATPEEAAKALLSAEQLAGKTDPQLKDAVQTEISTDINQIMSSPGFTKLWGDTLTSAQSQLVKQLASNSPAITLNLRPALVGAVAELKTTKFAPVADHIGIPDDAGILNLKGGSIDKAHRYYKWFQEATGGIVLTFILLVILSVWISVHHVRTIRRILIGTAIIAALLALVLQAPSIVPIKGNDQATIDAARAIAHVLFAKLQLACIVIAIAGIALAIGSKIYENMTAK